jgi:hypothetical protein
VPAELRADLRAMLAREALIVPCQTPTPTASNAGGLNSSTDRSRKIAPPLTREERKRLAAEGYRKVAVSRIETTLGYGHAKNAKITLERARGDGEVEEYKEDGARY